MIQGSNLRTPLWFYKLVFSPETDYSCYRNQTKTMMVTTMMAMMMATMTTMMNYTLCHYVSSTSLHVFQSVVIKLCVYLLINMKPVGRLGEANMRLDGTHFIKKDHENIIISYTYLANTISLKAPP